MASKSKSIGATVVIPIYNRSERLANFLNAVLKQSDQDFEVVVVDDGSQPPLEKICARFGTKVRYIRQHNAGAGPARNRAAKEASCELLAFNDNDCLPRPVWLSKLRKAHNANPGRLIGGHVINGLPKNTYASANQVLCDFLYDYFRAQNGELLFFTTNNMGCARRPFLALNGFDYAFPRAGAEDRGFGMRWSESGRHLHSVPDALVDHFNGMDLKSFYAKTGTMLEALTFCMSVWVH